MSLKKTIAAKNIEILNKKISQRKVTFAKDTKFIMNASTYTVIGAQTESGTEFRRVVNDFGTEEILTLKMLQDDLALGELILVDK